jgi:signal peptidase I
MEYFFTESYPDPQPDPASANAANVKRFLLDTLQTLLLSALLFLVINAVTARIRVESISMQPTLYEGDFVLVNRVVYKLGQPGRGDVIVFRQPRNPDAEPYIKRVIGLPGEVISIAEGQVYINGEALREPYLKTATGHDGSWQVPIDSLFVMGDNRFYSSDSREWGMVPLENVIGKAEVVYLPMSHWQMLNPSTAAAAEP